MKKQIFLFVLISLIVSLSFSSIEEVDYSRLYRDLKGSLNPIDFSKVNSQLVADDTEIANVLEGGINTYNMFAPYTKMEKRLKDVIAELANFQFTLRSVTSTNIYQSSVPATVLIVAPAAEAIGAGFVIDEPKGLILTNYHVTSGLKDLLVAFYEEGIQDFSKMKFNPASVYRYDAKKDIAILKLKSVPYSLKSLNIAEICNPKVGEEVHTIGHPMSLTWTYSKGQITAIRNKFRFGEEEVADVIQIDASTSPGNSGGPLLNNKGKVIGLVTFAYSSQYALNLNFAISCKEIMEVLRSRKDEDTEVSKLLKDLYGQQLFSLEDVLRECDSYQIDEDRDGDYDYISLVNKKTGKEEYRYISRIEYETDTGEMQKINLLCMDITEDGEMDVLFMDFNLDNKFDAIGIDISQDGEPDIIGVDSEGKGFITEAWFF